MRLIKWSHLSILLLILIILTLHFATILLPAQLVFDEQYYVPAAQSILQGEGTDRIEHPPLGQLFIASGISIFGDNPFGWRIFPVLFGAAEIFFFYLVCRRLGMPQKTAYLAAFLLAFENLTFIQGSIAMLDVFSVTFMIISFWLYLKGQYIPTGIAIGLASLAKLTGILALAVILLYWLLTNRRNLKQGILPLALTPLTFFLLMPIMEFVIWHKWLNPFTQLSFMLKANTLATFAGSPSEMLSRPWDWILKPEILTYWIDPHYVAMISPTLWALIIPAILFAAYKAIKGHKAALFVLTWFAGIYLIWIPISLITDRMSYIYYFYPAVGSVCIALALAASSIEALSWMSNFNNRLKRLIEMITPIYLLFCLGAFVILSPISYWWKLPLCVIAYFFARNSMSERHDYLKSECINTQNEVNKFAK